MSIKSSKSLVQDSTRATMKPDEDSVDATESSKMTSLQIQEMMANAQKMIEQRKRALGTVAPTTISTANLPPLQPLPPALAPRHTVPSIFIPDPIPSKIKQQPDEAEEKKQKLAELQAQIQSKLAGSAIKGKLDAALLATKPVPLLLDTEGRAIDTSGKQLLFPSHQPTLKANIRAQKRAEYKQQSSSTDKNNREGDASGEGSSKGGANKYFDQRLAPVAALKSTVERKKRQLKFNDPGKFIQQAHRERMQAQLNKLQQEIAEKAKKTGISTAARLAKLSGAITGEKPQEYIPQVEWWDSLLLEDNNNDEDDSMDGTGNSKEMITYDSPIKSDVITTLIEHPIPLKPPTEPHQPVLLPVFLTKKERKKLRRQNRREAWKEKQERVRLGLDSTPAPKVKISNLMRVLGVEAVQDPTKVEAHVRREMLKRQRTHLDANASRKLTPDQRRDKKMRKMDEDISLGVHVAVYRVDCMENHAKKFKVDTVARQLHLSGCIVLSRECNVIVVEGGPKQQRKYKRLMLHRIKWDEDVIRDKPDTPNKCILVWEGMAKERAFREIKFKTLKTEEQVKEYFKRHGIEQYWDLTLSGTVLEAVAGDMPL